MYAQVVSWPLSSLRADGVCEHLSHPRNTREGASCHDTPSRGLGVRLGLGGRGKEGPGSRSKSGKTFTKHGCSFHFFPHQMIAYCACRARPSSRLGSGPQQLCWQERLWESGSEGWVSSAGVRRGLRVSKTAGLLWERTCP